MVGRSSSPALMACLPVSLSPANPKGIGNNSLRLPNSRGDCVLRRIAPADTVAAEQLLQSTRSRVHASYPLDDRRMIAV
jgi:hypothetical protein